MIDLKPAPGATPLDADEAAALIPGHITTQAELDAYEQMNIQAGRAWALRQKKGRDLLEEAFIRELHARMLGRTWTWAGTFRRTNKNIGVDWQQIGLQLHNLLGDARYWIERGTDDADQIAVRFHHRLVFIHPFSNGNGRHSRLMGDLIARRLGRPEFTWGGGGQLVAGDAMRAQYIAALRAADAHDLQPLLAFARS